MKIIKLTFNTEDTVFLPLKENLEKGRWLDNPSDNNEWNGRQEIPFDTFEQLKEEWEKMEWAYGDYEPEVSLATKKEIKELELKNPTELSECNELGIICFKELMINPKHYNAPWDKEPNGLLYSCNLAVEAEKGELYSKDFDFFTCCECGRNICKQNPANGYRIQYKVKDAEEYELICCECWQKGILENGINIEELDTIPGDFFSTKEILEHNWTLENSILVGNGHSGSGISIKEFKEKLKNLGETNKILINYTSMSQIGDSAYIDLYIKDEENAMEHK